MTQTIPADAEARIVASTAGVGTRIVIPADITDRTRKLNVDRAEDDDVWQTVTGPDGEVIGEMSEGGYVDYVLAYAAYLDRTAA